MKSGAKYGSVPGWLADRLDWNLLRTFRVVAQQGGIGRAAAKLHLTQPAVSLALKRLEDVVGRNLVQRTAREFRLTPAGEEILSISNDVYSHIATVEMRLEGKEREITGLIRLLSVSRLDFGPYDDFLAEFHNTYPRIEISIEIQKSSDIISSILSNTVFAGLSICRLNSDKIVQLPLLRQKYAIFCGKHHHLFGKSDLELEALRDETFVSFTTDQLGDQLAPLTIFREMNRFRGRTVATSSSLDEVKRMIYSGFGIGFLPEHMAEADLSCGRLWRLPPYEGIGGFDIQFIWNRARKMTEAEQAFLDAFRGFVTDET